MDLSKLSLETQAIIKERIAQLPPPLQVDITTPFRYFRAVWVSLLVPTTKRHRKDLKFFIIEGTEDDFSVEAYFMKQNLKPGSLLGKATVMLWLKSVERAWIYQFGKGHVELFARILSISQKTNKAFKDSLESFEKFEQFLRNCNQRNRIMPKIGGHVTILDGKPPVQWKCLDRLVPFYTSDCFIAGGLTVEFYPFAMDNFMLSKTKTEPKSETSHSTN